MKKKLLITTDCFLPRWDGIARFLKELLPYLVKEFDVTVAAPRFEGEPQGIPKIKLHRYPLIKIRFGDIYFAWVERKEIKRLVKQADIVFNQTLGPIGHNAIKAASKLDIPIVSFVHNTEWELAPSAVRHGKFLIELLVKIFARCNYNHCDLLLTPSAEVSDLLSLNNVRTQKTTVPLGVNTNKFTPPLSKTAAKRAVGIDPQELVVGFCGRIGREKDLPTLFKAFRRIQHKHKTRLLIVGGGLEEEVYKNPRITLAGPKDDVVPYLQAMDVFVLPSLTETSSLATMEAMACGLPIIATPVGSIKEYVEDGVNGFLFPRRDIETLAQKLDGLLKSHKARETVGNEARKTIMQRATWEKTAQKIMRVLHELTS